MGDTTEKTMRELHAKLAEVLLEGMQMTDEDGNKIPTAPAFLNVARQFLKDNNIDAIPVKGSPLELLAQTMPFGEDDDTRAMLN